MKRYRQTVEQIVESLSVLKVSWKDEHAAAVISALERIPPQPRYEVADLRMLLDADFQAGLTVVRLVLDMSKDEFIPALRASLGGTPAGITSYRRDPDTYLQALASLGALETLAAVVQHPVSWRDILIERLKGGRGSAIIGQSRGRLLEDFVEGVVSRVFSDGGYDARCRFVGAGGNSSEKADFAIPSRSDPRILIEVKAYGATGSKQTDILGDIVRIVEQKRSDTHLLLVTDGMSWKQRVSDLRKLVEMQNQGLITSIYTCSMREMLERDLRTLKRDHDL